MIDASNKLTLVLKALTLMAALVILSDFILPGKIFVEEIVEVDKKRQKYYNAAGNYHYSYTLVTSKHKFPISEEFAESIEEEKVRYSVSVIFNEINRYSLFSSEKSTIYSLRLASGLVFPIIVLIVIIFDYLSNRNISLLIFVIQIILLVNLILLIL